MGTGMKASIYKIGYPELQKEFRIRYRSDTNLTFFISVSASFVERITPLASLTCEVTVLPLHHEEAASNSGRKY